MRRFVFNSVCLGILCILPAYLISKFKLFSSHVAPLQLHLSGVGNVRHAAERGILSLTVSTQGTDSRNVTYSVQNAANKIQDELRVLARRDTDGRPASDTAVLRWSSSGLAVRTWTTLYCVDKDGKEVSTFHNYGGHRCDPARHEEKSRRSYEASVQMTARFRDFDKLSAFTLGAANTPLVASTSVEWALTDETQAEMLTEAIKRAYENANMQARTYADTIGLKHVRPVNVKDGERDCGVYAHAQVASVDAHDSFYEGKRATTLSYVPKDIPFEVKIRALFEVE